MLQTIPDTIDHDDTNLVIRWKDGKQCTYDLLTLRRNCPCAVCRGGHEVDSVRTTGNIESIGFSGYKKVGRYALQITWSDGHNEGIYSLDELRKACDENRPFDGG